MNPIEFKTDLLDCHPDGHEIPIVFVGPRSIDSDLCPWRLTLICPKKGFNHDEIHTQPRAGTNHESASSPAQRQEFRLPPDRPAQSFAGGDSPGRSGGSEAQDSLH